MSYIYFIESPDTGHFKIGVSRNPTSRLHSLQRANPNALVLAAFIPVAERHHRKDTIALERRFHERYLPHHVRAEWFSDCGLIRADIAAINAGTFSLDDLPGTVSEGSLLRVVARGKRPTPTQSAAA